MSDVRLLSTVVPGQRIESPSVVRTEVVDELPYGAPVAVRETGPGGEITFYLSRAVTLEELADGLARVCTALSAMHTVLCCAS